MLGRMIRNRQHRLAAAVIFGALILAGLGVLLVR
jgi:hypothetical protein